MTSVVKWMMVLVLLTAVAVGGGGYWCYIRSDEMLRLEVLNQLGVLVPDVRFSIERANFDFTGRVRLQGLAIQLPDEMEPALYVPDVVITLDDDKLTDFETVTIERLRLVHPQLRAARSRDGRWNWQGIEFHGSDSQVLPQIEIEHGTILVELQGDRVARQLKLTDVNVSAAPSAARIMTGVISTRIDSAGPLTATIEASLDHSAFELDAKWLKLSVDDDLIRLLGDLSPEVESALRQAHRAMAEMAARQSAATSITRVGEPAGPSTRLQSQVSTSVVPASFGIKCEGDLFLKVRRSDSEKPLWFETLFEIREGQVSNPLLPLPLYQLHGAVYVDPTQVITRGLRAENGSTRLYLNGRMSPGQPLRGSLQVRNLAIDPPLKARLPAEMRKILGFVSLDGVCDLDINCKDVEGKASVEADLRLFQATASHERFPYPIQDVSGTARLRGNRIQVEAVGKASGVPITLDGWVIDPGPANESEFIIQANGVPINSTFIEACPAAVQKAIVDLNMQGRQDVWVRVWKVAGVGNRFNTQSDISLVDCSCSFKGFPYRINKLQGHVLSSEDLIVFKDLRGSHDATQITASGAYYRQLPGKLVLAVRAENAAFDRSLEAALPASLQRAWQEFRPTGRFDADADISWVPGQACRVSLPQIQVADTQFTMRGFPWPLHGIHGEFSYQAPKLTIKNLSAQHDDTRVQARGEALFTPGEPWQVEFDELHIDDLILNSTFRKALPEPLRKVVDSLNPSGKFSIETARPDPLDSTRIRRGLVKLSGGGKGSERISATWDVQLILAECALSAGIRIDDIHGRIDLAGQTNEETTFMTGQLDLDAISVFRKASGQAHQIARVTGPIRYEDGDFTAGSRVMAAPNSERTPLSEQISGDIIDGKLNLNVFVKLKPETEYWLGLGLVKGKLEAYAQQYLRGQSNLAGIMNGWLYLSGKGPSSELIRGKGELRIAPAALYELPLFVQIFRILRLDAADRTAFARADIVYNIDNSRFNFGKIDLVGSTISLRGRGYVRFDGAMQLDFYSMLARNQIRIPVLHEIAGALSRGWVGVKVTGTVGAPQSRIVPVPEFDEAFKQFLESFDPSPQRAAGRSTGSGMFQPSTN